MANKCSEKKLTRLLNANAKYLYGEANKVYSLESKDNRGLTVGLLISEYERTISIDLIPLHYSNPVFRISSKKVNAINCDTHNISIEVDWGKIVLYVNCYFFVTVILEDNFPKLQQEQNKAPLAYENYDLIELFGNLQEIIDKKSDTYAYTSKNQDLTFTLVFSEKIRYCYLTLSEDRFSKTIFQVKLINVKKISREGQNLRIFLLNLTRPITVNFAQGFALDMNLEEVN